MWGEARIRFSYAGDAAASTQAEGHKGQRIFGRYGLELDWTSASERGGRICRIGTVVSDTPKGIFPKSAHLLKRVDFRRVYENGKRHFSGNMTVFYLHRPPLAPENTNTGLAGLPVAGVMGARIGFTVPRAVGDSVERNRIRRRTREAVRQHYSELGGMVDVVINPRKSVLKADFAVLSQEVARAFAVIGQNARLGRQQPGALSRRSEKPRLTRE